MATLGEFALPGVDDRKGPELILGTFSYLLLIYGVT